MTKTSDTGSSPGGELHEEAVLRAVFARYGAALYRFGLRRTGEPALAETVVEETFVRAWREGDLVDPATFPGVGLLDRLYALADEVADEALSGREPAAATAPVRQRAAVDEALLRISEEHRQVIVETYLEGRGFDALAADVAEPTRTLRDRAFYALKALRQAMEETGVIR